MSESEGADGREAELSAWERELDARQSALRRRELQADARHRDADARDRGHTPERTPGGSGADRPAPGTLIGGRWRLEAFLARGGAGTVWRATDLRLQRPVAVKLLRTDLLDDGFAVERFRREAQLLARVEHEHVMRLFDVVTLGSQLCLVSEYVGGMSLRSLMERHARFPAAVVAAVGLQLASGIAAIHARGVVHRDLKPRNVMLTERGTLKIVDFGTARHMTAELTPTPDGQVAGSPAYLAPEQVEGHLGDPRTDLYTLGLILWEAAAGRRPFAGDTSTATALARLSAEVPDLRDAGAVVSRGLADVVTWLTRIDPRKRPRSAAEVVDALGRLTSTRTIDLVAALDPR
ncbi:serine/threonine-protein kinase [Egicoccus sp. AB-alg2]|uniref:serine/threonine-protein kinase n=1 Tax=Egicoccus sp. AB-alg2 TaxID=3242693 RepID=UPI00359D4912